MTRHAMVRRPVALMLLAVLAAGCDTSRSLTAPEPGSAASAAAAKGAQRYDGTTLFRGLVFGEGRIAKLFPEIWEGSSARDRALTAKQRAEIEAGKAELVRRMDRVDPTFFDRFAADVQSGSHVRVERAMENGRAVLGRVLEEVRGEAGAAGEATIQEDESIAGVTFVALAFALTAAAVVNLMLAANISVAMNIDLVYTQTRVMDSEIGGGVEAQSLRRDQVVGMIAERLAP